MLNEDVLKIVLNNKTFGRDEAADIVGGCKSILLLQIKTLSSGDMIVFVMNWKPVYLK